MVKKTEKEKKVASKKKATVSHVKAGKPVKDISKAPPTASPQKRAHQRPAPLPAKKALVEAKHKIKEAAGAKYKGVTRKLPAEKVLPAKETTISTVAIKQEVKEAAKPVILEQLREAKIVVPASKDTLTVEKKEASVYKKIIPQHETKPEIKKAVLEPKPEAKPEVKKVISEVKHEARPEVKHEGTSAVKPETRTEAAKVIPEAKAPVTKQLKELELSLPITVKDLSVKLQEKPSSLIKALMDMKMMVGINQVLEDSLVTAICEKYGFQIKKALDEEELALSVHQKKDAPGELRHRAPIVTFMGHVDHGKTSLLDAIRKSKVAESEHGGITQHIGAYRVVLPGGEITFLDTPGHEAFTAMRARGASVTDIVVLVVAADDGIMPQTQEAIDHARAAGVTIMVAINKIDKPQANVDRVKKQLADLDLNPEDWGGKTITVGVSAKTGKGIDELLEMILLEAQMLELKANPSRMAYGVVIEAKMSKGRGPVATLLVENGTLHLNENILVGKYYGKIRAMFDDHGRSITSAGASFPVEILGMSAVPEAGEQFFAIDDEKMARELAMKRQEKERLEQVKAVKRISLEDLHVQIQEGKLKELKLIVKADVQGSLEAIRESLNKMNVSEIKLDFIHQGVGTINSSDIILAVASNALVLGFNVVADERAKELVAKEGVDVRVYNIIYELGNDIKAAIEGMLEPKLKKVFLGRVEVRKVFKLSRSGIVAGCFVSKGKVTRNCSISLLRNGQLTFEGNVSSLKRFKDDVREVAEGFECGMTLSGFDTLQEGDLIEAYEIEKIARKL